MLEEEIGAREEKVGEDEVLAGEDLSGDSSGKGSKNGMGGTCRLHKRANTTATAHPQP